MSLKKCPRCGGRNIAMSFRVSPLRWKVVCTYCKFMPEKPARTQWGARRIWNKSSCTRVIGKKVSK